MKNGKRSQWTQTLEHVGLSENEAHLYTLLLRYPDCTVRTLQSKTPFPRTMLYYVLNRLVEQGLVNVSESGKKKTFSANSPDRLYDLLEKKEEEHARQTDTLRRLVPDLKHRYRLAGKRPDVRIFEGMDAYKQVLDELVLEAPNEVLAFGEPDARSVAGLEARETHDRRRQRKKIVKKVLLHKTNQTTVYLQGREYNDYTQFRFLPKDIKPFSTDLQIFNGKILYTTYEDREPIAILTEDTSLAHMQTQLFSFFWERSEDATLLAYQS